MAASNLAEEAPASAEPMQEPEPDLTGTTLERYRLLRRLGVGGMGAVYEAEHVQLHKRFAVKMLRAELAQNELFRRRFLREARAASAVSHPHIVDISDFGETPNGRVFFVMELLEGRDLQSLLDAEGRLSWPRTQEILLQVASALEAAHRQGVIHRDIKPSNCYLVESAADDNEVFVKVLDFGIAKISNSLDKATSHLTSTQEIFGTIAYMSPEMAIGIHDNFRSDIYSLGVMMYRMLVGELPFSEGNAFQILSQHVHDPPPRPRDKQPSIPEGVEAIILKALAKNPNERFSSMGEFKRALQRGSLDVSGEHVALQTTMLPGQAKALADASPPPVEKTMALSSIIDDSAPRVVMPELAARRISGSTVACEPVELPAPQSEAAPATVVPVLPHEPSGPIQALEIPTAELETAPTATEAPSKRRKRLTLWIVLPVLAVTSGIGVGLFIANRTSEEPTVAASTPPAPASGSARPDAAPAIAPSEPEREPEPIPSAPLIEPEQTPREEAPSPVEQAEPAETPPMIEPPVEPTQAPHATHPSPPRPPKHKPKPKTDRQVVEGLKARIIAKCMVKGDTTVRIEGVISSAGTLASPLITPSTGPGACAKKLVLAAKFDPAGGVRPMPRFSVAL